MAYRFFFSSAHLAFIVLFGDDKDVFLDPPKSIHRSGRIMQTDQLWTHPGKCCVGDIGLKMVLWGRKRMEQHLFGDLGKGFPEEEILKEEQAFGGWVKKWGGEHSSRGNHVWTGIMKSRMERSVVLWEWWGLTHGESLRHEDILEEGHLSRAEMKNMPAESLIPAFLEDS